jgi:uncharacterized membrane protein
MFEKISNQIGEFNYLFYDYILFTILALIILIPLIAIFVIKKRKNGNIETKHDIKNTSSKIINEQNTKSMNILKERLAKGEISKYEYDELKKEFEN